MARINVNATLVQSKLLLGVVDRTQRLRAEVTRVKNIEDRTRSGADFSALATALGVSAAEAEDIYSRLTALETTLNTILFQNLADIDQG